MNAKTKPVVTNPIVSQYSPQPGENQRLVWQVRCQHSKMGEVTLPYATVSEANEAAKFISQFGYCPPLPTEAERRAELEGLLVPNDTKIKFCNAFHELQKHLGNCDSCCEYLYHGDGDLCGHGKAIIGKHVAYSDTNPESCA